MMWEYLVGLLNCGVRSGEFRVADPERDARVLLYSIAFFFPHAMNVPASPPTEADFLLVLNWFLEVWKRSGVIPASSSRRRVGDAYTPAKTRAKETIS